MAMQNPPSRLPATTSSSALAQCAKEGRAFPDCAPDFAAERAKLLIGSFPNARPHDPQVYAGAVALLLTTYPRETVAAVTDPRNGIQTRHIFPPTLAELKGALEEELKPYRRQAGERLKALQEKNKDPIVSAEAQARIQDGLKYLAESLRASTDKMLSEDRADQAALKEKLAALMGKRPAVEPTSAE